MNKLCVFGISLIATMIFCGCTKVTYQDDRFMPILANERTKGDSLSFASPVAYEIVGRVTGNGYIDMLQNAAAHGADDVINVVTETKFMQPTRYSGIAIRYYSRPKPEQVILRKNDAFTESTAKSR